MLGRGVAEELRRRPPEAVWSEELRSLAAKCDLVVCNLECCISERGEPTRAIPGKPFFFRAPPEAVGALRTLGVGAVSLANNHALDYGEAALEDTLELLEAGGIAAAGGGRDREGARRGAVVEAAGTRVGLLGLTDHPAVYAAGEDSAGVAFDPLERGLPDWARAELRRLAGETDLVIAFPHWGPNMATEPTRRRRDLAAQLLGAGADLVAGHSAHVFHGAERHEHGLALYDLGGAADDYVTDPALRNDLGLLALWLPGGEPELELAGLRLRYARTELAGGADADWIGARLELACAELGTTVERLGENRFALG